ncbi:DUF599 domain-containing protein [Roseovarius sp.]|jgi:uncharacterized membrane protein|uniref:DUF599 domain-containing protein n=1 Tax=Roseovarius sp. TaxID=1486281 RepID=UPI003512AE61
MDLMDRLSLFSTLDQVAVALLLLGWQGMGFWIENSGGRHPSVSWLMADYRRAWMQTMLDRDPRIFDSQILAMLRQGTTFFASATMIAMGGCMALLGNTDKLITLADDLTFDRTPEIVWEIKIILLLGFLASAFFKFVWSNRLFAYCAVVMGTVPNDRNAPGGARRAAQAGELNITAARSFNRGLRAIYFALAAAAWLIGAEALIVGSVIVTVIVGRREFASQSRRILLSNMPELSEDARRTGT